VVELAPADLFVAVAAEVVELVLVVVAAAESWVVAGPADSLVVVELVAVA